MYQIITDIADLRPEWLREHPEVSVASSIVLAAGEGKHLQFYDSVEPPESFLKIDKLFRDGYSISSSMPVLRGAGLTPPSVEELATAALDKGRDVLYLAVNSTISGTYGAVSPLFKELEELYPDRKLICIDSECASTGLNMLVKDLAASGITDAVQARDYCLLHRSEIAHLFSWQELDYIFKSGKVVGILALLGRLLHFKPFCSCEYDEHNVRHLTTVGVKLRSEQKLAEKAARFIKATITDECGVITINYANSPDFAKRFEKEIRRELPSAQILCGPDYRVGITIQAHGGPTSIHINYHRKREGNTLAESKKLFGSL